MDVTTTMTNGKPHQSGEASVEEVQNVSSAEDEKKPRRALTAYNFFFQAERQRLLNNTDGTQMGEKKKLGFAGLARHISSKWKNLNSVDRLPYEQMAGVEKDRYNREKKEWKKAKKERTKTLKSKGNEACTPQKRGGVPSHVSTSKTRTPAARLPIIPSETESMPPPFSRNDVSLESILNDAVVVGSNEDVKQVPGSSIHSLNDVDSLMMGDNTSKDEDDMLATDAGAPQQVLSCQSTNTDIQAMQNLATELGDDCVQYVISLFH